jgi:PAS domain S-box-containing protein
MSKNAASMEWLVNSSDPPSSPAPLPAPSPGSGLYLQLLIEAASDYAIFAMDQERRVTMWNLGAERMFRFGEKEIVGQSADIIFTPEDRAAHAPETEASEALLKGRAADERWHMRKNGERFYASGVMSPLRNVDGTHIGFVKITRDLTRAKLAEQELRISRDQLNRRVHERTLELQQINEALRDEIASRQAAEQGRQQLLRRVVTAQEQERLRIAREMHDELGQHVAALMWRLNALDLAVARTPHQPLVAEAQRLVELIGREVHVLAVQLRPTALDDLGLPGAISAFVEIWSTRSGIPVETQFVNVQGSRLPADMELALYRIVQEALTNILKHAGASRVGLVATRTASGVVLSIEDDGRGFSTEQADSSASGLGLVGMRERAAGVGGQIEIESSPGHGTTVLVRVPLRPA